MYKLIYINMNFRDYTQSALPFQSEILACVKKTGRRQPGNTGGGRRLFCQTAFFRVFLRPFCAVPVAQLEERQFPKLKVAGSIPVGCANDFFAQRQPENGCRFFQAAFSRRRCTQTANLLPPRLIKSNKSAFPASAACPTASRPFRRSNAPYAAIPAGGRAIVRPAAAPRLRGCARRRCR